MASATEARRSEDGATTSLPPRRDLPFWAYALQLWTVGALAVSNVFMGLSALALLIARARGRGAADARFRALPKGLARPLVVLVLAFLASIAFSYQPLSSLARLDDLLSLLPLLLAIQVVRSETQARVVVRGLVLMGVLVAAFGLLQVAAGAADVDLGRRMPGPFSHYQTFAGVLLLCGALAFARLVCGRPVAAMPGGGSALRWRTAGTLAAVAVLGTALSLNLTRGSWVALLGALTFALAVRRPRHLLWVAPAAVALMLVAPAPVRERLASIFDLRDGSNYDRLCMIDAGLRMVAERPLLGLGPGVVEARYPLYRHPTAPRDHRPHLHNSYLQIAAEHGLVSLAAFVALLAASFARAMRLYRREGGASGPRADLWLGVAAALVAYTLAAFFEDNWADTEVQKVALFVIALPFCLDSQTVVAWPNSSSS